MTGALFVSCVAIGAAGRRLQGGWFNGFRWTALVVYTVLCVGLSAQLERAVGAFPAIGLAAVFLGASVAWLTIKTDNGGAGRPLRRYGPFGLGYFFADRYKPEWHDVLGEAWLGGTWFGFLALVVEAIK